MPNLRIVMRNFARTFGYAVMWLAFTVLCGYLGSWWPIRNVPPQDLWAGDGIGMMLFGSIGLLVGGVLGLLGLAALAVFRRRKTKEAQPGAQADGPASGGSVAQLKR
ncbi:MAG TPA: hypothetical protein VIT23_08195 [Terrimicrobiaceae bacterium]